MEITEGTVNIENGEVVEKDLNAHASATVVINGGTFLDDIKTYGNSKLHLNDGAVTDGIGLYSDKKSRITGGTVGGGIWVGDESVSTELEISGGILNGRLHCSNESLITIQGTNFNFPLGEICRLIEISPEDPEGEPTYQEINRTGILTGTLSNGDPINVKFFIYGNSNIVLEE